MVEIFTVGGGDYLVNVFQAVAAWTGNGATEPAPGGDGDGAGLSAITLAFNQDWRAGSTGSSAQRSSTPASWCRGSMSM
jgi:conjugal transfer mating pair stabilization protein TraG